MLVLQMVAEPACHALPKDRYQSAYLLTQSTNVFGKRRSYVAADGSLKMVSNQGCVVICTAPSWRPFAYNPQSETFCAVDPDLWGHDYAMLYTFKADISKEKFVFSRNTTLLGQRARVYVFVPKSANEVAKVEYTEAEDIGLSPQSSSFLARFYRLPVRKGAPLRLAFFDKRNRISYVFDTQAIEKTTISALAFKRPEGLTESSDRMLVKTGSFGDVLRDMTESLGPADKKKAPSPHR